MTLDDGSWKLIWLDAFNAALTGILASSPERINEQWRTHVEDASGVADLAVEAYLAAFEKRFPS